MSSESGSLSTKAAVVIIVVILLIGGIGGAIYYLYLIPDDEGEPIVIQGQVIDENGTAISDATVSFGTHHTITNATGYYSLDAYTRSDDSIVANETGHWTQERKANFNDSSSPVQMNFTLTRNVMALVVIAIIYVVGDPDIISTEVLIDTGFGTEVVVKDTLGDDSYFVSHEGTGTSRIILGSGSFSLCAFLPITGKYSETPGTYDEAWPVSRFNNFVTLENYFPEYLDFDNVSSIQTITTSIGPEGLSGSSGMDDSFVQPEQLWPNADINILGKTANVELESSWNVKGVDSSYSITFTPKTIDGSDRILKIYYDDGITHLLQTNQHPDLDKKQ